MKHSKRRQRRQFTIDPTWLSALTTAYAIVQVWWDLRW